MGSSKMEDSNLLGFIEEVSGDQHLRVEEDYGQGFVRLRSAEAERRQAKHDIRCVEDIVIGARRPQDPSPKGEAPLADEDFEI